MNANFLVSREDLKTTRWSTTDKLVAADQEVVLAVAQFALTANNITYGVAGDSIGYWKFFPAEEGWGKIPVWGVGRVTASSHANVTVGDRYYGYFPMSSELRVQPARVSPRGFVDSSEHRSALPPVYNQYSLMSAENGFDPAFDQHQMVYRPLFTTSFVLDDYLADNQFFGAESVVIGSASSKTGFGLAFQLRQSGQVRIIGLTSAQNLDFVRGLGLYDEVVSYDDIESLDSTLRTAYVDMSGNRKVLARVHHHFKDKLTSSCGVGITHWNDREGESTSQLPGAKPSGFFAPSQIQKRSAEWGPAEYQRRLTAATELFFSKVDRWVTIDQHPFNELERVYNEVLAGALPDHAYVVTVA